MEYFGRILFSWIAKNRFAYVGAGGVPIAVPLSWCQNESPNWKILFFIISESSSMRALTGTLENLYSRWCRYCAISMSAIDVFMLVYIEVASDVNSLAPGGSGDRTMMRSLSSLEFLMYVFWAVATVRRCVLTQMPRW